jgi:phosphomannomutase
VSVSDLGARAEAWAASDPDPATEAELRELVSRGAEAELRDAFAGRLQFGTAGLRGVIGPGPNRMNRAVVRQATAGLARYLLRVAPDATRRGVVVGRDARRMSDAFAEDAAGVLAGHGIPALVFPGPVPTPLGAFAVRELRAAAGVVVTASHNPPEYNGYKVYWGNGAQIIPPHDLGIAEEIEKAPPAREVPLLSTGEARTRSLYREIGPEVERAYTEAVLRLRAFGGPVADLRLVTTALHGVGARFLDRVLREAGFVKVHEVAEQREPDGRFPTVRFPNPEEPGALDLAFSLAERVKADLVLANDPDADRLAVAARDATGVLRAFGGNDIGVLLGHYLLTRGACPPRKPLVVTTIVSSAQLGAIARDLHARYEETLTGFKWIANRALEVEQAEEVEFVFGYEEALGYAPGTAVRDKDGISAALVFADLAAWCQSRGTTAWGYLEEIQRRHGLFLAGQRSFTFPGAEGPATIRRVMDGFREAPPARISGLEVVAAKDYLRRIARDARGERALELPSSNVIAYELAGGSRVTLRPSGTEPKIKYYFERREEPEAGEATATAAARGRERVEELARDFLVLARERGQPG